MAPYFSDSSSLVERVTYLLRARYPSSRYGWMVLAWRNQLGSCLITDLALGLSPTPRRSDRLPHFSRSSATGSWRRDDQRGRAILIERTAPTMSPPHFASFTPDDSTNRTWLISAFIRSISSLPIRAINRPPQNPVKRGLSKITPFRNSPIGSRVISACKNRAYRWTPAKTDGVSVSMVIH